jgi:hypothetical protein
MAHIGLGIGTSHTPMLSLPAEKWDEYAQGDRRNSELVFPPEGRAMSFEEGAGHVPTAVREKPRDLGTFQKQAAACQAALDTLATTLQETKPDITVIISDDQDEWFYESNMPRFAVFWGKTAPLRVRPVPTGPNGRAPAMAQMIARGYGDRDLDVPVPSAFGRFVIEYLNDHDFDVAHFNYLEEQYGGRVARRYPTKNGELDAVRSSPQRAQGLPHGFAFVVKRLFDNQPSPILPIFQNTCYPPNTPTPKRSFELGQALAGAIEAWPEDATVAVVASGGLSHFVVDEELDRTLLSGLERKDANVLKTLPRHRLYSATSESLNWVAVGGAVQNTPLQMELVDYVPVYRTEAGTGGGWAFARWQ